MSRRVSRLYPSALREAAEELERRPVPGDFTTEDGLLLWTQLKTCITRVERRLKLRAFRRTYPALAKLLIELQDHYVDFSIALGADDVYSLTEFAETSE